MRARRELAFGLGAFLVLGALVAIEALTAEGGTLDPRLSTFRAEPNGARAWADGLGRLGHRVERWRRPFSALPASRAKGALLAILAPDIELGFLDQRMLRRWSADGGDLLLVGGGGEFAMNCLGWRRDPLEPAGVPGSAVVAGTPIRIPAVHVRLSTIQDSVTVDSSRSSDLGIRECTRVVGGAVDTLLRAPSGAPLAVRLRPRDGGTITLVADAYLLTNRALRETPAGEFALSLVPTAATNVIVDEYHHAYGTPESLTAAIFEWSTTSPLGWILWQAGAVGVFALLLGMIRTGPIRTLPAPSRRSPLEHVDALARTLAATRGHDVAVLVLVRGLRRRLSADGRPPRDDPRTWLAGLKERVRTDAARRAVARLLELTRPGQGAVEVLAAANAVEDVWQELRP